MADPKPITLTQVEENSYTGAFEPQPFVVVGDVPGGETLDLTSLPGYDAGETQVLTNTAGTIEWVTAE